MEKYFLSDDYYIKKIIKKKITSGFYISKNDANSIYTTENKDNTYFYVDKDLPNSNLSTRNTEDFSEWINFLEKKAIDAFERKRKEENSHCIIKDLKNEVLNKYKEEKYNYLESFLDDSEVGLQVSLPSLFNSVRFIYEIPSDVIDKSFFFVDQDSLYVNMAFVYSDSRLDLTFKDNGEVSFRFVDCEGGRVRITGTSFFGLGKNQKETRKINKLLNFVKKGF